MSSRWDLETLAPFLILISILLLETLRVQKELKSFENDAELGEKAVSVCGGSSHTPETDLRKWESCSPNPCSVHQRASK